MTTIHNKLNVPIYQPEITEREKLYVNECLDSTWISSKGKYISLFEERFSAFTGNRYAAAVSNGTVALHAALLALGIGRGDEVLVPTLTYIASPNAVKYCNATPVFVDSAADTWQIDPDQIVRKITPHTKAIMVVHLYGFPCDMDAICRIADAYQLSIIEDCAQAFGTYYRGLHVGNFGQIATYSFFGNKTITCGEGGMVVTNDSSLDQKVRQIKGQGVLRGEYQHEILGYNYRLTNIQAALGAAGLERASRTLAAKKKLAERYMKCLPTLTFLSEGEEIKSSHWMVSCLTESEVVRDRVRAHLSEYGVETRPVFPPCHLMPYYGEGKGDYPVAESLAVRGLSLPSWPGLSAKQIESICDLINEVI